MFGCCSPSPFMFIIPFPFSFSPSNGNGRFPRLLSGCDNDVSIGAIVPA